MRTVTSAPEERAPRGERSASTRFIRVLGLGVCLILAASLWCSPLSAFEIPLADLFWGPPSPSLIEDTAIYPPSHLSLEFGYWDIYHEKRGERFHDYHQASQRFRGIRQSERMLVGVRVTRASLSIEQENVYTDTDRMDGRAEVGEGELILGTTRLRGEYWGGAREFQITGSAGYRDGFAADLETLVGWGRYASVRLRMETFENNFAVSEEIAGYRFPFEFDYRTYRFSGEAESQPFGHYRFRLWGGFEESSGAGGESDGFENRPKSDRSSIAGEADYRLARRDRFQNTPRLLPGTGSFPGVRLAFSRNDAAVDLGMYMHGTRYLRLDNLRVTESTVQLDVVPVLWCSLIGGWQRIRVEHEGDSFFDVWPFTIWDVFAAKRYRLGDSDAELEAWYIGLGLLAETGWCQIDVASRFEWWDDGGVLNLLERVDDLFPFFFHYERTENDVDISAKYAIQVKPSFLFRLARNLDLRVFGRIAFPFGKEHVSGGETGGGGESPSPGGHSEESTHGGIVGRVELIVGI
jgi:hypothetical protein